jgi:hypothetical protein
MTLNVFLVIIGIKQKGLQKKMNIEITKKERKLYYADCVNLPGSPPIGLGKSLEKALIALLVRLLYSDTFKKYFNDYELKITLDGKDFKWNEYE